MFDPFLRRFPPDGPASPADLPPLYRVTGLQTFLEAWSGQSFGGGIYNAVDQARIEALSALVFGLFPDFAKRARVFGYDWQGRAFAFDGARRQGEEPLTLLFDPSAREVFEIPVDFRDFHNSELVEQADAALAEPDFLRLVTPADRLTEPGRILGMKVPFFLGGELERENLQTIDIEVYWDLTAQLAAQVSAKG